MTTRQDLLTHWQEQLLLAEVADDARSSWRGRIRLRLYRFLLAMYGGAVWTGSPHEADEVTSHPSPLMVSDEVQLPESPDEATLHDHGKAPRTRAEILRGLKHVRGLSDELAPPGPLQDGLPADAPVAVATCKKAPRARRLMSQLRAAGFAPTLVRRANFSQIFVRASQATAALEVISQLERAAALSQPGRILIRSDRTHPALAGALLSGCLGIPLSFYLLCWWQSREGFSPPASIEFDGFALAVATAAVLDFLAVFLIWFAWRDIYQSAERSGPGPS